MKIKPVTRVASGVSVAVVMAALGVPASNAFAAPSAPQTVTSTSGTRNTLEVTGTFQGRTFSGTASNLTTAVVNGKAVLKGTISGAGLDATSFTADVRSVTAAPPDPATPPAAAPAPVAPIPMPVLPPRSNLPLCEVLTLDVDNLHLDLLGLKVIIPPPGLHVVVAGQARPGALLGQLLCGIAGGPQPAAAPAPAVAPAPAPVTPAPAAAPAPGLVPATAPVVAPVASAVAPVASAVAPVASAVAPVVAPVTGALPGK